MLTLQEDLNHVKTHVHGNRPTKSVVKVGIPHDDKIVKNIGRFRYFVAGNYQINRRYVSEQ